ncbi:MAG: ribonuclease Z [Candidatus Bathyarchaeum sp.]|nr:MAG: ribonuclease Z [Candidatus Bathyarchaeum sp.]
MGGCNELADLQVIFLGTGGSIPTPQRGLSAIAIRRRDELFLFDCGEGTQRQMTRAGVGFHRKTKIFITHMHGDHVLGLPGLLQTMSLLDREKKLEIYGPQGIKAFVETISQTVQFTLTFPVEVSETESGLVCKQREYEVYTTQSNHMIPALAYALTEKPRPGRFHLEKAKSLGVPEGPLWSKLQAGSPVKLPDGRIVRSVMVLGPPRPGRKIVYTGDTRPSENLVRLAENADLLIHEATFDDELLERAGEDGHSTPSQAAKTAKEAGAKRLVLTHISARYKDASLLLEQARKVFSNTDLAEDFLKIDLPLSEA